MAASQNSYAKLKAQVSALGFHCFGVFAMEADEFGVLIGNAGGAMWEHFAASAEYGDKQPDRLNRWTKRTLSGLSQAYGCRVIYPFDQPYPPFQQFSHLATGVRQSPLGLLCHSEYGLWHAYRGVFVFDGDSPIIDELKKLIQEVHKQIHPCDECSEKPCLSACPVSAFSDEGLNVATCFGHLDNGETPKCMELGCAARSACPVGQEHRYGPDQIKFHMQAYRH